MSEKIVEVCDSCLRACCWYGEFMCDNAKNAGTVRKTTTELAKLNLENSQYWTDEYMYEVYGQANPFLSL